MSELERAPDLQLRVVRYFVAVAEHAHFGRAAEALHVGQPTLSRQVRELERVLGARLFERTPQGSRLTDAGRAFLPEARALLQASVRAAAAVRGVPGSGLLRVGYAPGLVVSGAVRDLRRRHPEITVETIYLGWRRPGEVLLDRQVDVVVARLPFATAGLDVRRLHDEPRLLVLPRDHRLAGRASVTLDDIEGEPMPWVPGLDPACRAFWRLEPRPDGVQAPAGPAMASLDDTWEHVAQGQVLAVVAASHRQIVRPDLELVPIRGVAPSTTVLAVRAGERAALAADFERSVLAVRERRSAG